MSNNKWESYMTYSRKLGFWILDHSGVLLAVKSPLSIVHTVWGAAIDATRNYR